MKEHRPTTAVVLVALAAFVAVLCAVPAAAAEMDGNGMAQRPPMRPKGTCCVAGTYTGTNRDTPSATCTEPGNDSFTMILSQGPGCGANLSGTVTGASDPSHVQTLTGRVVPAMGRECCAINGTLGSPKESTQFQGNLCLKDGKYTGSGTYTTTRGAVKCDGNWQMTQQ